MLMIEFYFGEFLSYRVNFSSSLIGTYCSMLMTLDGVLRSLYLYLKKAGI